jgi:hypothetical protein
MMNHCVSCGIELGNRNLTDRCQDCRRVCRCGRPKDYRAEECRWCSNVRTAKDQWARPEVRARMVAAMTSRGQRIRRRYEDLTEEVFTMRKPDGRRFGYYWDRETETRRYIYRYQWRWEQANGSIPAGMHLHHKNMDPSDDCLENLELLTPEAHRSYHAHDLRTTRKMLAHRGDTPVPVLSLTCEQCGRGFRARQRKDRSQRYCSLDCYHAAQQSA